MRQRGALGQIAAEVGSSLGALRRSFGSPAMARVQSAYVAFNLMEWAAYIAIQVYAFTRSGIAMVGVIALVQLIPSAFVGPLASVLGDRYPRHRVLLGAYLALTVMTAATGAAMLADLPALVVYVTGSIASWTVSVVRPVHAALLPQVARTPEELSVGYAASSLIESASILMGPLLAGLVLWLADRAGVSGPGLVDVTLALLLLLGALLVARVRPLTDAAIATERPTGIGGELTEGFRTAWRDPRARVVLGLIGLGWFTLGVVDAAMVYLAFEVLDTGEAGVGFLNAALGAGAVVGAMATVVVSTRPRLLPGFRAGVVLEGSPLVVAGAVPALAPVMLAVSGGGGQLTDTTGTIMLQRLIPDRKLARVFGVLESVFTAPEGLGGFLGALSLATVGPAWTLAVAGSLLPILGFVLRRRIAAVDVGQRDAADEMALLRRNPIFAPLPPGPLDRLARNAVPEVVPAGRVVIREGDRGDRFYAVVSGAVEVSRAGDEVGRLTDGDGFGEIALLRDVPRTATVTAVVETRLLAIEREDFLLALSGHLDAGRVADSVADDRLGGAAP